MVDLPKGAIGSNGPQGPTGTRGIPGQSGPVGEGTYRHDFVKTLGTGGSGGAALDELLNTNIVLNANCENYFIPPFSTTFYTASSKTNASTSYLASSLKN